MRAIFCVLLLVVISTVYGRRSLPVPKFVVNNSPNYKYRTFDAQIDNFDITGTSGTFSVKYLINTDSYKPNGPLFFYTGNEGTIEGFADNTGIMFDLAPQFNALIVFCEHRYYGNGSSSPFGKHSFAFVDFAKYLTIEQTLADYVNLIGQLKQEFKLSSVIAFGGSYGGMLTAWFREKYPNVVDGGWAASAPVAYFRNSGVEMGGFDKVVTRTMEKFGCRKDVVIDSFEKLDHVSRGNLNRIFNTDPIKSPINSPEDFQNLKNYIREGFEYMAMTCYPYPAKFLRELGAWPMLQACKSLKTIQQRPEQAAQALKNAMDAFYDPTKPTCFNQDKCGDSATAGLGDLHGWAFQSCTQIPIDICAQGPQNDVFWQDCSKATFESFFKSGCDDLGNVINGYQSKMVQFDYIQQNYGFDLFGTTNLILTQGYLDPWSVGGVVLNEKDALKRNIFKYSIDGAAHHLDLRLPNTCDPLPVTHARYQIVNILKCWTGQNGKNCDNPALLKSPLPTWDGPTVNTDCKDLNNQYPWGLEPATTQSSTSSQSTSSTPSTPSTLSTQSVQTTKANPVGSTKSNSGKTTVKADSASNRPLALSFLSILTLFSIIKF